MKKTRLVVLLCMLLVGFLVQAQNLVTGSFNIRYANQNDTGNLWVDRAPVCAALIRFHQFDIVGTQEGLRHQLDDLQNALPGYAFYGLGRDDAKTKGEHSAIFYKKDRFLVKDSGDFWLSEKPDAPGWGWDAKHNRICTWLKLEDKKAKKIFYVFNVHYDHQGVVARTESSKLILKKIQAIAGKNPVVLMGDFNGNHQSDWYLQIQNSSNLKDTYTLAKDPYVNNGSFNSFRPFPKSKDIIDHIFISKRFKVIRYGVLTDTYHGKFPSDHYPVLAELSY